MPDGTRPVLTLRFHDPNTYRLLKLVAEHRRVSMNDIAEEALQEHLQGELTTIEQTLREALTVVQRYRREDLDRDIDAFAHAEVTQEDPLRSTGIVLDNDPFGVRQAFVRSVE